MQGFISSLEPLRVCSPLVQIAASHVIEVFRPAYVVYGQIANVRDMECAFPGPMRMIVSAPWSGKHHRRRHLSLRRDS